MPKASFYANLSKIATGGGPVEPISDVFDIQSWTGTTTNLDIASTVDTSQRGLIWTRRRGFFSSNSGFFPNESVFSGAFEHLMSGQGSTSSQDSILQRTSTTYRVNGTTDTSQLANGTAGTGFVGYTFKDSAEFFKVINYTGNGTAGHTIAHGLNSKPGMVWIRQLGNTVNTVAQHTSILGGQHGTVETSSVFTTDNTIFNSTTMDSTNVTLGDNSATLSVNKDLTDYVMYVFGNDSSRISCGSYIGTGAAGISVTCGFQPRFIMVKNAEGGSDWYVFDTERGLDTTSDEYFRTSNLGFPTNFGNAFDLNATGFTVQSTNVAVNVTSKVFIYMAIA